MDGLSESVQSDTLARAERLAMRVRQECFSTLRYLQRSQKSKWLDEIAGAGDSRSSRLDDDGDALVLRGVHEEASGDSLRHDVESTGGVHTMREKKQTAAPLGSTTSSTPPSTPCSAQPDSGVHGVGRGDGVVDAIERKRKRCEDLSQSLSNEPTAPDGSTKEGYEAPTSTRVPHPTTTTSITRPMGQSAHERRQWRMQMLKRKRQRLQHEVKVAELMAQRQCTAGRDEPMVARVHALHDAERTLKELEQGLSFVRRQRVGLEKEVSQEERLMEEHRAIQRSLRKQLSLKETSRSTINDEMFKANQRLLQGLRLVVDGLGDGEQGGGQGLRSLLHRLLRAALHDTSNEEMPYVHADGSDDADLLVRAGVAIRHPSSADMIRLVPFHT